MSPNVTLPQTWTTRESCALCIYPATVHLFFYGLHVSLFGTAVGIILLRKRQSYHQRVHLFALALLFTICTASAVVRFVFTGLDTSRIPYSNVIPVDITIGLHFLANLIADALLIYRCYHIWAPRKSILYPPILGLLANVGVGIAALVDWNFYWVFMIVTLVENLYLTAMTAGRIWYINRESKGMLGSRVHSRYQVIVASVLESGLLYPLALIVTATSFALPKRSFAQILMINIMMSVQIQIVGIAQSLIIVRVGLGVDFSNAMETGFAELSDLEAATPAQDGVITRHFEEVAAGRQAVNSNSTPALHTNPYLGETR